MSFSHFPHLLEGLTEAQQEAVCHKDGPLLVLAGPGSGKTRVVTHRIAALLAQNVSSSQIVALTFTNKAADEMKKRIAALVSHQYVWIGTFHKFCAHLLRQFAPFAGLSDRFTIYDTDESKKLLDGLLDSRKLPPGINAAKIQAAISWAKNGLILPEQFQPRPGSLLSEAVDNVYAKYQEELKRANAVDFDDLLVHIAVLLRDQPEIRQRIAHRFHYLLVDEYQDTNLAQYAIARSLAAEHRNLSVTGDPDQSIYGWRGADLRNILDFEKDFPDAKVVKLERNYRSTPQILSVAAHLIAYNKHRKKKRLYTENTDGPRVRLLKCRDQREEADAIALEIATEVAAGHRRPSDYAIFYRMNALSRNLEHALRRENVPFQLVRGLEFFNRKEVKDLIAYLNLLHNPSDTVSLMRIINEPVRGIGRTTLKKLADHAMQYGMATLEAARNVQDIPGISPRIRKSVAAFVAMTDELMQMAGGEYPVEAILREVLEKTKYKEQFDPDESEEDQERLENIEELLSEAREFDKRPLDEGETPLGAFLEQAALVSDVDALETESDRVSLMTFHAAKGLEFPVVYIMGLEENILPHERSMGDPMQLEEERRLLFVGITRARQGLRLSRCEQREFRGRNSFAIMSRFLFELPNEELELCDGTSVMRFIDEPYVVYEKDETASDTIDPAYDEFEGIDIEYDDAGRPIPPKKAEKKQRPKFSLMTAAELEAERKKKKPF